MVHFTQSLIPDMPLATSLPTTYTFQPNNNQIDEQSSLQQQNPSSSSSSQLTSSNLQQRSSSSHDDSNATNHQLHPNDYETRLRCPNCDTWVVNLSDHLRKTHRIASPVDRKPLLRMARLEKRRMTESANNPSTTNRQTPSTLIVNGIQGSHTNTNANNEIENLLFKHEQDANQQYAVAIPENILLNHSLANPIGPFTSPTTGNKRQRTSDDHTGQTINGLLSPNKKSRLDILDGSKLSQTGQSSSSKTSKKNRNKQQQQQQPQSQPQTIIKTAASGIFPQQNLPVQQHLEETSDDLSKVLQMMGNEMNFLNQHLQTTSILLQKQLELARDSLHACSVQFAHLKRMIQQ